MSPFRIFPLAAFLLVTSCVTTPLPPEEGEHRAALLHLKQAEEKPCPLHNAPPSTSAPPRRQKTCSHHPHPARPAGQIYNKAAADLTVLLRAAASGSLWNRPLTLTSGGTTYRLRFAKATRDGIWDPAYFTSFTPADEVKLKTIKRRNLRDGLGGALVGVRKTNPLEPFTPACRHHRSGHRRARFQGPRCDPQPRRSHQEKPSPGRPAQHVTSPPIFPRLSPTIPRNPNTGTASWAPSASSNYMKTTGLYLLQPYDPDRIPLIFVHGLISTPRMWRNVINESKPTRRCAENYQCWVFSYPTGNPPAYSAMRFREELAKVRELYPNSRTTCSSATAWAASFPGCRPPPLPASHGMSLARTGEQHLRQCEKRQPH